MNEMSKKKFEELVKSGKLTEDVMNNPEFVKDLIDYFKSKDIVMSKEKLEELIKSVEKALRGELKDGELDIIGGGNGGKTYCPESVVNGAATSIHFVLGYDNSNSVVVDPLGGKLGDEILKVCSEE